MLAMPDIPPTSPKAPASSENLLAIAERSRGDPAGGDGPPTRALARALAPHRVASTIARVRRLSSPDDRRGCWTWLRTRLARAMAREGADGEEIRRGIEELRAALRDARLDAVFLAPSGRNEAAAGSVGSDDNASAVRGGGTPAAGTER